MDHLIKEILSKVDNNKGRIVLQAGHYSLIPQRDGTLVPAIHQEINDERLTQFIYENKFMGDFPEKTFNLGVDLFKLLEKSYDVRFSFIVNDWQWITNSIYNTNESSLDYYHRNSIPISFQAFFNKVGFEKIANAVKNQHNIFLNSELQLRESGKKAIPDCTPNNCAIEYFPYLKGLSNEFEHLISFIPETCRIPVLYATMLFLEDHDREITHVFYCPLRKRFETIHLNRLLLDNFLKKQISGEFLAKEFELNTASNRVDGRRP